MTAAKCGDDSVDDDDEDDEDDEGDEGDEEINVGGVGFGTGVDDGGKTSALGEVEQGDGPTGAFPRVGDLHFRLCSAFGRC